DLPIGPHVTLDRPDRTLDIGDGLALRPLADDPLAVLGEGDHRWGGAGALSVRDHRRLAAFEDGNDGVGCAEVDADGSCHGDCLRVGSVSLRLEADGVQSYSLCPGPSNQLSRAGSPSLDHADGHDSTEIEQAE